MTIKVGDIVSCSKIGRRELGKVLEIRPYPRIFKFLIKFRDGRQVPFKKNEVLEAQVPNNKLSKVMYPKYVESKCKKYLLPEEYSEI